MTGWACMTAYPATGNRREAFVEFIIFLGLGFSTQDGQPHGGSVQNGRVAQRQRVRVFV